MDLLAVLERSRAAGYLGPGPIDSHLTHAQRYAAAIGPARGQHVLDLGSGGGLPGLVIFHERPDLSGCLLDAMLKRTDFLTWAVAELGMADRVVVARGRAEVLAHEPAYRSKFNAVVARSFGPPAATVEAALGFLAEQATLAISEPPGGRAWPDLSEYGLVPRGGADTPDGTAVFKCISVADAQYPRPIRKQQRNPLF